MGTTLSSSRDSTSCWVFFSFLAILLVSSKKSLTKGRSFVKNSMGSSPSAFHFRRSSFEIEAASLIKYFSASVRRGKGVESGNVWSKSRTK